MKPGIYTLPFQDYRVIQAWGASSLRAMRRGPPARVIWERENPLEATDAIRVGAAAHCRFLTPELYGQVYVAKPVGMTFASKEGKLWRDAQGGLEIIPAADAEIVAQITLALHKKELVAKSLEKALQIESSLIWTCPESGELCKGRPDWLTDDYVYDLKISRHAAGGSLAYRAYMDGWMAQLAHYRTGCLALGMSNVLGGRLVVVAPKAPHFVYCLEVKTEALNMLEMENINLLKEMGKCRASGVWPSTEDAWRKIEPPATALVELGEIDWQNETEDAAL